MKPSTSAHMPLAATGLQRKPFGSLHTKTLLAALTASAMLAGSASAAVIIPMSKITAGSANGILMAIDSPVSPPATDPGDLGWLQVSGGGNSNSADYGKFWEPDGSSQTNGNGQRWTNGTVSWTFDLPDGTTITDVYVSWGKVQGNTSGGTYSYSETASDSTNLNQLVNPAGDLQLAWTDSTNVVRGSSFTRLDFSDITVTGGDGFTLTTVANGIVWSDAVVIDFTVIPEPSTALLGGLGFLGLILRRRR